MYLKYIESSVKCLYVYILSDHKCSPSLFNDKNSSNQYHYVTLISELSIKNLYKSLVRNCIVSGTRTKSGVYKQYIRIGLIVMFSYLISFFACFSGKVKTNYISLPYSMLLYLPPAKKSKIKITRTSHQIYIRSSEKSAL